MTQKEKWFLAMHASELIMRLRFCEDKEFAAFVTQCVVSGDVTALEPQNLK